MNCVLLVTSPSLLVLCGDTDLASVHALVGNEGLGVVLEPVGVAEGDLGQRSAATAVVDNLLDYTADVAIALRLPLLAFDFPCTELPARCVASSEVAVGCEICAVGVWTYEVERAELGGGLVQAGVGREDRATALTLVADDTTHGD